MGYKTIILLSAVAGLSGICFYGSFNEWIILRNPWKIPHYTTPSSQFSKKKIALYLWRHDAWHTEYITLRLPESLQEEALVILQAWFHEAAQAGCIPNSCTLEAALYDARTGCLYLSCTASPLDTQKSTYGNLVVLESLLKTIRENLTTQIQAVQLLVNHAPLEHPHIICTKPMAIAGFAILP